MTTDVGRGRAMRCEVCNDIISPWMISALGIRVEVLKEMGSQMNFDICPFSFRRKKYRSHCEIHKPLGCHFSILLFEEAAIERNGAPVNRKDIEMHLVGYNERSFVLELFKGILY